MGQCDADFHSRIGGRGIGAHSVNEIEVSVELGLGMSHEGEFASSWLNLQRNYGNNFSLYAT